MTTTPEPLHDKLLPCPFCADDGPHVWESTNPSSNKVRKGVTCLSCRCTAPLESWNTRPTPSPCSLEEVGVWKPRRKSMLEMEGAFAEFERPPRFDALPTDTPVERAKKALADPLTFIDANPEVNYTADNDCPACGGSGHVGDASDTITLKREEVERVLTPLRIGANYRFGDGDVTASFEDGIRILTSALDGE